MMHTRFIAATVSAVAVLALAGCASASGGAAAPTSSDGLTTVKVAMLPGNPTSAATLLGVKEGIFEKAGLDVEVVDADANVTVSALTTGQADFGWTSANAAFLAQQNGIDVKSIAGYTETGDDPDAFPYQLVVTDDSPINSAKDLEGKTIAVDLLGQWPQMLTLTMLEDEGADASTIKFTEISRPDMLDSLKSGAVAAAAIPEPFLTTALTSGTRVLESLSAPKALQDLPLATYMASGDYITKNPEVVKKFAAAVAESNAYARDHEQEVRDLIPTYTSYTPDQANVIRLYTWADDSDDTAGWEQWKTMLKDQGFLTNDISVDQVRAKS